MTDVTIIGGGLAALSTAWAALQAHFTVTLCWIPRVGAASNAAAGMLSPLAEADTAEPPLIEMALRSCAIYPSWVQSIEQASGLKCAYRPSGTVIAALSRDHMADLHRLAAFHEQHGLRTQWLSRTDLFELEPNIATRQVGGIWAKEDHSINPRALHHALFTALSKDSRLRCIQASQISLEIRGHQLARIHIDSPKEAVTLHSQAILCDGAWKDCAQDVLDKLPLRPVKGQYIIAQGPELVHHTTRSPDVYVVPRANGQLYLGASMEEEGFDTRQTAGAQLDLLYHSWQLFRGIYELDILEHGFGFRPALRDHQPAIGPTPIEGLYLNTGHFRHGVMLAPLAAEHCVQFLSQPAMESPFTPMRFWS